MNSFDHSHRRERLPNRRAGERFEIIFDNHLFVVTIGEYADGRLAEVFINALKSASAYGHLARDTGILLSFALQHGASADTLSKAVSRDDNGVAQGLAGHVIDAIMNQFGELFGSAR
jgi:hypothetical protein